MLRSKEMEPKDTVKMTSEEDKAIWNISNFLRIAREIGREEGIKEVVGWISVNRPRLWHETDRQDKLKEWGIDVKESE